MLPGSSGTPFEVKSGTGGSDLSGQHLVFPEEAVQPGDTWQTPYEFSVPLPGAEPGSPTSRTEVSYRFDGLDVRDGVRFALISLTGPVKINGPMGLVFLGEMNGRMELDLDAGRIHSKTITSSATGSGEIMGYGITMAIETRMEQTILR